MFMISLSPPLFGSVPLISFFIAKIVHTSTYKKFNKLKQKKKCGREVFNADFFVTSRSLDC